MNREKRNWLKEIGFLKLTETVYSGTFPDGTNMLYSKKYLTETPLTRLKEIAQTFGVIANG